MPTTELCALLGNLILKEHGLHLIVIPRDCPMAESVPCDTIILPAGLIADCVAFTRKPNKEADLPAAMAALQFVMAHELAHLYLQHGVSAGTVACCLQAGAGLAPALVML